METSYHGMSLVCLNCVPEEKKKKHKSLFNPFSLIFSPLLTGFHSLHPRSYHCSSCHNSSYYSGSVLLLPPFQPVTYTVQTNDMTQVSLVAQIVKNLPTVETQIWSLGWEAPLEKGMATHSSILTWRNPWTEEPSGLQFMGLQRVRHWVTYTFTCSSDSRPKPTRRWGHILEYGPLNYACHPMSCARVYC